MMEGEKKDDEKKDGKKEDKKEDKKAVDGGNWEPDDWGGNWESREGYDDSSSVIYEPDTTERVYFE